MAIQTLDPKPSGCPNSISWYTQTVSSTYSIIPSVFQSKLSTLASIGRRACNVVVQPLPQRLLQCESNIGPPITPLLRSRRGSDSSTPIKALSIDVVDSTKGSAHSEHDSDAINTPAVCNLPASGSCDVDGIDWPTAEAGIRLWLTARSHMELQSRNPALLRSMYIDAVRYMSMALPQNLSPAEIERIQSSIPSSPQSTYQAKSTVTLSQRNILRRSVAQLVYLFINIITLLVPLLVLIINKAIVYDSQYQITGRALNASKDMLKVLCVRGFKLGESVVEFSDTPIGKMVAEATSWTIEGLVDGVNDGLVQSTRSQGIRLDWLPINLDCRI